MAINFLYPTNTRPEIQINDTDDNPRLAFLESDLVSGGISTTGGNLVFEASSGIERARILSGGNFGIGTDNPVTKLNVAGNIAVTATKAYRMYNAANTGWGEMSFIEVDNRIQFNRGIQNSGFDWRLSENSADSYVCALQGNFGIGTATPSVNLDIEDSSNVIVDMNTTTANANTTIRFQESDTVKATIGYDGTNNGLILTTGGFTAGNGIFIDDTQKVGIGTDNPLDVLHVKNLDAAGGNGRCDIRLENGIRILLSLALYQVTPEYNPMAQKLLLYQVVLVLFYGSNWTFGSNLGAVTVLTVN